MKTKYLISAILIFLALPILAQKRPKIGIALSGGGAKGLAHIGLLKAIDSAGIRVDYVAGTSMGAIVGGMYAAGYSGAEIEKYVRQVNWNRILTNKPEFRQLILPQKQENDKFLDIPLVKGKLYFGKGMLESNELWLTLSHYFFPYLTLSDFDSLPRKFRCVATNLDNGSAVVLKNGSLVKAIRASMAIPSVFTPVKIGEHTLIDGGLSRNFPVSEVREMGANIVIGSSVTSPQLASDAIDNPFQMISQIAFYGDKRDYEIQVRASDIFVDYPIGHYSAASFGSSDEIIRMGIRRGEEMYPVFKRLKDSLDRSYGADDTVKICARKQDKILVSSFTSEGLDPVEAAYFMKRLNFQENQEYTPESLSEHIRTVFSTGIFRKINYELSNNPDGSTNVCLDFEREPPTIIKTGLNYNTETGIALKVGLMRYGLLGPFSASFAGISLGENPQMALRNVYFFDRDRRLYVESSITGERTEMSVYNNNLSKTGLYNQKHLKAEVNLYKILSSNLLVGIGTRYEYLKYIPIIQTPQEAEGKINFVNSYAELKYNTLDAAYNPNAGSIVQAEAGVNFNQNPQFRYNDGNTILTEKSPAFSTKPYVTFRYYSAHYVPVYSHTIFLKVNSGIHLGNKLPMLNYFAVGGNNFVARNQVIFSGFRLNSLSSASVVAAQMGYKYKIAPSWFVSAGASWLWHDFVNNNLDIPSQKNGTAIGLDLTVGFRSVIGPIETSFIYNSINDRIIASFNVGYSFNFSK
ncbi:patatin-like phospholipase family protein [Flexibacter flexilis]|nr:patatin-like phospholipase family protein [Flexibacter flexilis]